MLVQLLGVSHPDDLFNNDFLPTVFPRLWYFVASISFRSIEAFAHYLRVPEAMSGLREMLPLTKKQCNMIDEERVQECMKAQLQARGSDHGGQACA
eukprot:11130315-Karenia_brevis.AAC.1